MRAIWMYGRMPPRTRSSAIVKDTSEPFERWKYHALHARNRRWRLPADDGAPHARRGGAGGVHVHPVADVQHVFRLHVPHLTRSPVASRIRLERPDLHVGRTEDRIESPVNPQRPKLGARRV